MSGYRDGRVFYYVTDRGKTVDEMQWELAAKYLAGEGSGEERRRFEEWLGQDPERRAMIDSLRPSFAVRTAPRAQVDVDAAWTRVAQRIERDSLRVESGRGGAFRRPDSLRLRRGLAAAAVLVVAAAASFAVIRQLPDAGRVAIATGPGEKQAVTLADGSRIVVAPLSRVEMVGARTAKLVGEAYFVVVHDSSRPFRVETGDATIEDLGTSFVVRTGSARQPTFVAVQEGVVSLASAASRGRTEALVLREGESGTVSSGRAVRGDSAMWSHGLAWTRGEIVFHDMRLPDVARELNRWFGITVVLSDSSLESRTFSARFRGERVDEVLEAIDRSLGVTHSRTGNSVVFKP